MKQPSMLGTRRAFLARSIAAGLMATASISAARGSALQRHSKPGMGGSILISGATIIDAVSDRPIEGKSIWIEAGRIKAIGGRDELGVPRSTKATDATGKFVIPGLMDANVHLMTAVQLEQLARYFGRYEQLITEAAQVALKAGLTTVFDTWGPRRFLMAVRDRINAGEIAGSRIFCAGNIIGFDGPFSPDFFLKETDASPSMVRKINAIWVENVGRHLMWLPPERVAEEVRAYIAKGIDFIKYGANEHWPGAFLAFSEQTQAAMVQAAHRAGVTAQSHIMSIEGLRTSIEAGCDLIQHANVTGPVAIPEATLELMAKRKVGAVVFPFTQRRLEILMRKFDPVARAAYSSVDINARSLIKSGAPLLMAADANIPAPETLTDPEMEVDNPNRLGTGHLAWFKAMEQMSCPPLEMLRAATRNVAVAYKKDKDYGSIEAGKVADLVILDKNPLQAAENYGSVYRVLKDGAVVDRDVLPTNPVFTKPMEGPVEEEETYVPFLKRD